MSFKPVFLDLGSLSNLQVSEYIYKKMTLQGSLISERYSANLILLLQRDVLARIQELSELKLIMHSFTYSTKLKIPTKPPGIHGNYYGLLITFRERLLELKMSFSNNVNFTP